MLRRINRFGLCLCFVLFSLLPAFAQGGQTITLGVPKKDIHTLAVALAVRTNAVKRDDDAAFIKARVLLKLYTNDPKFAQNAPQVMASLSSSLSLAKTYVQGLELFKQGYLGVAKVGRVPAPVLKVLGLVTDELIDIEARRIRTQTQNSFFPSPNLIFEANQSIPEQGMQDLIGVITAAKGNGGIRTDNDVVMGQMLQTHMMNALGLPPQFHWDKTFTQVKNSIPEIAAAIVSDQIEAAMNAQPTNPVCTLDQNALQQGMEQDLQKATTALGQDVKKQLEALKPELKNIVESVLRKSDEEKKRTAEIQHAQAIIAEINEQGPRVSVNLAATLIGFANPRLGRQISVVGNSALDIYKAYEGFTRAMDAINTIGTVSNLTKAFAGAALTLNVLNAATAIMGLFSDPQVSVDQIILEQIQAVQQQLNTLRQEMHERFDRIDKKLDEMHTALIDGINAIRADLGRIEGNVNAILTNLYVLQAALNRLDTSLYDQLQYGFDQDFYLTFNGSLDYVRSTGARLPYQNFTYNYISAANIFLTWGDQFSWESARAGNPITANTDFSNFGAVQALRQSARDPLGAAINYLNAWPQRVAGLPRLSDHVVINELGFSMANYDHRIANPRSWIMSSEAYRALGQENPDHALFYDPTFVRYNRLTRIGEILRQSLRSIRLIKNAQGQTVANHALFDELSTNYSNEVATVAGKIAAMESEFASNNVAPSPPDGSVFPAFNTLPLIKLFGKADDAIDWYSDTSIEWNPRPALVLTNDAKAKFLVASPFKFADYLGKNNVPRYKTDLQSVFPRLRIVVDGCGHAGETISYTGPWQYHVTQWTNPTETTSWRRRIETKTQVHLTVGVIYDNVIIARVLFISSDQFARARMEYAGGDAQNIGSILRTEYTDTSLAFIDASQWVQDNWNSDTLGRRSAMIAQAQTIVPTSDQRRQRNRKQLMVAEWVTKSLGVYQAQFYKQIANSFPATVPGTPFNTDLMNKGIALTGAKEIRDAYLALGLPQTLEQIDILRALIYGSQRVIDKDRIREIFQQAANELEEGMPTRIDFKSVALAQEEALNEVIKLLLTEIQEGRIDEFNPSLENQLQTLKTWHDLVETGREIGMQYTVNTVLGIQVVSTRTTFDRASQRYKQSITLRNAGTAAIAGSISLAFDRSGTHPARQVKGQSSTTLYTTPIGSSYLDINVGADDVWSPNETVEVMVEFLPPPAPHSASLPPRYNLRVLAGHGLR